MNLTIGAYRDSKARPWELTCVSKAVKIINKKPNYSYLPPGGDKEFTKLAIELAYSKDENGLFAGIYKNE